MHPSYFPPSDFSPSNSHFVSDSLPPLEDARTTPREVIQDLWRQECTKKKGSLFNFMVSSQELREVPVNIANLKNYFKVPVEKIEDWPKDHEILELFEKVVSR